RVETAFGYHAESWQEVNANLLGIFNLQALVSSFVVAALLCTGGFAILAIQVMIVLQKTRDIAILRSIGFQRGDIMAIVLVQGMILAIVGGLVGCLIGHGLVLALSLVRTHQEGVVKSEHLLMHDDPRMYVYAVVFTFIVGVVASLLPALRASSVEPVEVLRGQIG
ncbi:MAG TPA: FtsX-like permease family protein, partial [Polyangiaceae bacterium]|nr:FtsX-like permease family protein [Polyangiaceae bacterium]